MDLETTDLPQLYVHRTRKKWGLAILAWEGRDRRRYQFQDGKARTFKAGFFSFLEEVDKPRDEAEDIISELSKKLDIVRARRQVVRQAEKTGKAIIPFKDQLKVFGHVFEGGFQDPAWVEEVRGEGARRRKGHLDPAVVDAREAWGKDQLEAQIKAGDWAGIHARAVKVLTGTSLTSASAHVSVLRQLPEEKHEAFARALYALLWGGDQLEARFDAMVALLSWSAAKKPTWQLTTAFLGLAHPTEHVVVRPSVFRLQARWMAPRLDYEPTPSGDLYSRFLAMAERVRNHIKKAGYEPRDMLDIHKFIWHTLRPKGQDVMKAETPAASAS